MHVYISIKQTQIIGKKLQVLRIECDLSQQDVSKFFGWTSSQHVSNWERGMVLPSTKVLSEIIKLYKLSPRQRSSLKNLILNTIDSNFTQIFSNN